MCHFSQWIAIANLIPSHLRYFQWTCFQQCNLSPMLWFNTIEIPDVATNDVWNVMITHANYKDWYSLDKVPYCFSRSSIKFLGQMGWKINDLNQVWVRLLSWSQLSNPSDLPYLFSCKMIKQNQLEIHLILLCHFCETPFLLVKHTVTWISWNWHSYIVVSFIVRTLNPRNSKV